MSDNIVEHWRYGRGKVLKSRYGGFEVKVLFDDGIERWVRSDQLEGVSYIPSSTPPFIEKLSQSVFSAREIIEALRLGIVPYKYISELTFGREREIKSVNKWLSSEEGCYIVSGEYGSGKTHFLQYVYYKALKDDWAVSFVDLDINEITFSKPKNLYRKIVSTFRFREKDGNFREFLRTLAFEDKTGLLEGHKYLYEVVSRINRGVEDETMWNWIEGDTVGRYRPMLHSYSTCGNIYSYILTAIGWALNKILGKKGFLILFDEAESLEPYWYTTYQRARAQNFLKGLVMAADNNETLLGEDIGFSFSGGTYGSLVGRKTGLQYCGYARVPFLWKNPSHLKLLFALPPIETIYEKEPFKDVRRLTLFPINISVLKEYVQLIAKLYRKAYGFDAKISEKVFSHKEIRLFVKALIESFDISRFENGPSVP